MSLRFAPAFVASLVTVAPILAAAQPIPFERSLTVGAISPVLLVHVAYLAIMGIAGLLVVSRRLDRLLLK